MTRYLLLTLLFLQIAQQPAAPRTGSIEGVVLAQDTNNPVEDARVELAGVRSDSSRTAPVSVMTRGDGKFVFRSLEPAAYHLTFSGNGYVGRGFPAAGRITLLSGQEIKSLVIPMTSTGSVSGRIRDRNGDPLIGVPVQLMQFVYDDMGRRTMQPVALTRTDQTNDRGEYRLFFINPGPYYLYAGNPWVNRQLQYNDSSMHRASFYETYAAAYFPGVTNSREAIAVNVKPGADVRGIDLILERQPTYRVRGRIIDSKTGKAPDSPQITLRLNDAALDPSHNGEYVAGEKASYDNGVFEFRNVTPGSFSVSAVALEDVVIRTVPNWPQRMAYAPVVVGNSDVDNVLITIPSSATLTGRWSTDKQLPPNSIPRVRLTPLSTASAPMRGYDVALNTDGALEVESLAPGEYQVSPRLPAGFYLKEARFAGSDVLNRPLRFTGNLPGSLDIQVSGAAGSVEGVALDNKLQPVPNATVVLVPRFRERTDLFRSGIANESGRFTISSVVPGDYRVFAWEKLDQSYGYFEPDLLRRSEANSTAVSISESSRRSVSVRVQTTTP